MKIIWLVGLCILILTSACEDSSHRSDDEPMPTELNDQLDLDVIGDQGIEQEADAAPVLEPYLCQSLVALVNGESSRLHREAMVSLTQETLPLILTHLTNYGL